MNKANGREGVEIEVNGERRDGLTVHHTRQRDRQIVDRNLYFGAVYGALDLFNAGPVRIVIRYSDPAAFEVEIVGAYFDDAGHFGACLILSNGVVASAPEQTMVDAFRASFGSRAALVY